MSTEEQAFLISGLEDISDPSKIYYWIEDGGTKEHPMKGIWYLYLPKCGIGNLMNHQVQVNLDGTITVTPSILVTGHHRGTKMVRHGYLTNGIWKEV